MGEKGRSIKRFTVYKEDKRLCASFVLFRKACVKDITKNIHV
jgi:hypothetical protein